MIRPDRVASGCATLTPRTSERLDTLSLRSYRDSPVSFKFCAPMYLVSCILGVSCPIGTRCVSQLLRSRHPSLQPPSSSAAEPSLKYEWPRRHTIIPTWEKVPSATNHTSTPRSSREGLVPSVSWSAAILLLARIQLLKPPGRAPQ